MEQEALILVGISVAFAFASTIVLMPYLLKRLKRAGIVGVDVNKPEKPSIPEMGGLAALIGFSVAIMAISLFISKRIDNYDPALFVAIIGVFAIAGLIGAIDDIVGISRRKKLMYAMFACIPLIVCRAGSPEIMTPFYTFDLSSVYWLYLFVLIPIGITGAANALNMSAGYNGLESGTAVIISFFLLLVSLITGNEVAALIFSCLLGTAIVLYLFNKYPAKIFVGDIGTLGMGATIAAGCIMGNIEFYGFICVVPAFYELFATIYYGIKKVERRGACMNPIILSDGRLKPPKGAGKYTLAYSLLSKVPMREDKLVNKILIIYATCGMLVLGLTIFG
jgi:UDP-N-acetylglucosamine--dolichyl-phosphate N-acetylglucosaminephosphotransferase